MHDRRPDVAEVAHQAAVGLVAGGRDAFPAQAGVGRPLGRRVPLVLRIEREARGRGLEVLAELGEQRFAVLQRGARLGAARALELGAGDDAVLAVDKRE